MRGAPNTATSTYVQAFARCGRGISAVCDAHDQWQQTKEDGEASGAIDEVGERIEHDTLPGQRFIAGL
jgi:hypothetical protein